MVLLGVARAEEPAPAPLPADPAATPAADPTPAAAKRDLQIFRPIPTGLATGSRFGRPMKLYPSDKKVTENNFFFAGLYPKLNPASAQLGVGGELQPASIFNVRVLGELQQYFGTFGFLQSFGSANANYSDQTLADNKDAGNPSTEPQATLVKHLSIQPMLQLKFGKIALRSLLQLDYWNADIRSGDVAFYEPTFDTLLPDQGWTMSTDTDLLYVTGTGLAAGLRHTYVRPFYNDKHFTGMADENAYDGKNAHHRLGFFGAYTIKDNGPSTFNKPTLILIVSFYLEHKYRAGEPDTLGPGEDAGDFRTRAFPYFIAGFAFESDFLAVD